MSREDDQRAAEPRPVQVIRRLLAQGQHPLSDDSQALLAEYDRLRAELAETRVAAEAVVALRDDEYVADPGPRYVTAIEALRRAVRGDARTAAHVSDHADHGNTTGADVSDRADDGDAHTEGADAPEGQALVDALVASGWTRTGGRAGMYVRLKRDTPVSPTTLVPLDTSAPDYPELLAAARAEIGNVPAAPADDTAWKSVCEELHLDAGAPESVVVGRLRLLKSRYERLSAAAGHVVPADDTATPVGWCCAQMQRTSTTSCSEHVDTPDACPDVLVTWSEQHGPGLPIPGSAGGGMIVIRHCPWCGTDLTGAAPADDTAADEVLLVRLDGRKGGQVTVGHSRLPVTTVLRALGRDGTIATAQAAYPSLTDEQGRVLDALRRELAADDTAAPDLTRDSDEWCVFYGGPEPDEAAGLEIVGREEAEESSQWLIESGVAVRRVYRSPWQVREQCPSCRSVLDGRDDCCDARQAKAGGGSSPASTAEEGRTGPNWVTDAEVGPPAGARVHHGPSNRAGVVTGGYDRDLDEVGVKFDVGGHAIVKVRSLVQITAFGAPVIDPTIAEGIRLEDIRYRTPRDLGIGSTPTIGEEPT